MRHAAKLQEAGRFLLGGLFLRHFAGGNWAGVRRWYKLPGWYAVRSMERAVEGGRCLAGVGNSDSCQVTHDGSEWVSGKREVGKQLEMLEGVDARLDAPEVERKGVKK